MGMSRLACGCIFKLEAIMEVTVQHLEDVKFEVWSMPL